MKLPPELTDTIIDCVHDDKKALSSCGRVSKSWLKRSRHYLWRRIVIDSTHETMKRLSVFSEIIRDSPESVSQIEYLELSLLDDTLSDEIIAQLPSLIRLETLILNNLTVQIIPNDITFSQSLSKLAVSHTAFEDLLDWHQFIVALPNLRDLTLGPGITSRFLNPRSTTFDLPTTDFVLRLSRLNLNFENDHHPPMLYWLAATVSSIETEVLRVRCLPPDIHWLHHFWQRCLPSLQSLEIDAAFANDSRDTSFLIHLQYAQRLQSVMLLTPARLLPFRLSVLVRAVFFKLPARVRLSKFVVVLQPFTDDGPTIRDTWLVLWHGLRIHEANMFHSCSDIVLRTLHPMMWDDYLLAGIVPLQEVAPGIRLEYTTQDGEVHTFVDTARGEDGGPVIRPGISQDTLDLLTAFNII